MSETSVMYWELLLHMIAIDNMRDANDSSPSASGSSGDDESTEVSNRFSPSGAKWDS